MTRQSTGATLKAGESILLATCAEVKASDQARRAAIARRESGRRRFVDPSTCERDYTEAELEFLRAMDDYKKRSGRLFPTWSEVLEVVRSLGYVQAQGT